MWSASLLITPNRDRFGVIRCLALNSITLNQTEPQISKLNQHPITLNPNVLERNSAD